MNETCYQKKQIFPDHLTKPPTKNFQTTCLPHAVICFAHNFGIDIDLTLTLINFDVGLNLININYQH